MAGHARYTALLDACVLFPLAMVDSLMSLAEAGLYAAKWSTRIEEEWMLALETKRPDLKGRLGTRRDAMHEAVPDWRCRRLPGRRSFVACSCRILTTPTSWPQRSLDMRTASSP